jgi:hypothetical protein
MADISQPIETWFVNNISKQTLVVNNYPQLPVMKPGDRLDLFKYLTLDEINSSAILISYMAKGLLLSEGYLHTHDDKTFIGHSHGINDISPTPATESDLSLHTSSTKNVHGIVDTSDLTTNSGGIKQFPKLTVDEEQINDAVGLSHEEIHTIVSHEDTIATGEQLDTLVGGESISLHTHSHNNLSSISGSGNYHISQSDYNELIPWLRKVVLTPAGDMVTDGGDIHADEIEANAIHLEDNEKIYFGDTKDAEIYFDGECLIIDTLSPSGGCIRIPDLQIDFRLDTGDKFYFGDNNDTSIHFDGECLVIQSENPSVSCIRITDLSVDSLYFGDNEKLYFGDDADYSICWDGDDAVHTISSGDFVFNGGNVGIGTNSPGYKLDVNGSVNIAYGQSYDSENSVGSTAELASLGYGYLGLAAGNHNSALLAESAGTNAFQIGQTLSGISGKYYLQSLAFHTGSAERVRIDSSGNVGINTTTPSEKLHVNGNAWINGDNNKLYFGGHQEASIYFDGECLIIESENPSAYCVRIPDLHIDSLHFGDNEKLYFGDEDDTAIYFDGTDFIINPQDGSGGGSTKVITDATIADGVATGGYLSLGGGGDFRLYSDGVDGFIDIVNNNPSAILGDLRINPDGLNVYGAWGNNLVLNGDFNDGSDNWVETRTWSYGDDAGDYYVERDVPTASSQISQTISGLSAGNLYKLIIDVAADTVGPSSVTVILGGVTNTIDTGGIRTTLEYIVLATSSGDLIMSATGFGPQGMTIKVWDVQVCPAISWEVGNLKSYGDVEFGTLFSTYSTDHSGTRSLALSEGATASGGYSTAIGRDSSATGTDSITLGTDCTATGTGGAVAIGNNCDATGTNTSIAIGRSTSANGGTDIAMGSFVVNNGSTAFVIGDNITNNTNDCVAMGDGSINFRLTSTGLKLGSDSLASEVLDITGNVWINGDNNKLYFGKNQDASIYFDGDCLVIESENPSASCLRITDLIVDSLHFGDNDKLYFGDEDDTALYFDGSDFIIDTDEHSLTVTSSGASGQSSIVSGLVVNDGSGGAAQDDFRVETTSVSNAFVVDASADTVNTNTGRIMKTSRYTTTQTLSAQDHIVFCDTSADWTLTLPAGVEGTEYHITNCGVGGFTLTIDADGTETINGDLTQEIEDEESIHIIYNVTEKWRVF